MCLAFPSHSDTHYCTPDNLEACMSDIKICIFLLLKACGHPLRSEPVQREIREIKGTEVLYLYFLLIHRNNNITTTNYDYR